MAPSTDIVVIEPGGFVALNHDLDDVAALIEDNLGDEEVGEFNLSRITFPSGKPPYRWEIPTLTGSAPQDTFDGIIILKKQTRAFWPVSIDDGGGNTPPSCSSPDARRGYGKQWATKLDPDPAGDPRLVVCKQCPNSQFGSDGGRGQACQQKAQLFVLVENGLLPTVVSIPPASLKPLTNYMMALANAGIRHTDVVTTFGLGETANAGGTAHALLRLELAGRLAPDDVERARGYAAMAKDTFAQPIDLERLAERAAAVDQVADPEEAVAS
jgi:hypothetical protein